MTSWRSLRWQLAAIVAAHLLGLALIVWLFVAFGRP